MNDVEVNLERQLLFPGESVTGTVEISGRGSNSVKLTLHGEETFRPYIGLDTIHPILEETVTVKCTPGAKTPFTLPLPENLSATYTSDSLRCTYYLKIRREHRILGSIPVPSLSRASLTIETLPPDEEELEHQLEFSEHGVKVEVGLNQRSLEPGESLNGSFSIEKDENAEPPGRLVFSLSLIEETLNKSHRLVLGRVESQIDLGDVKEFPVVGSFELVLPEHTSPTGEWKSFKVHCGFRVKAEWDGPEKKDARASFPITVLPRLVPQPPADFAQKTTAE